MSELKLTPHQELAQINSRIAMLREGAGSEFWGFVRAAAENSEAQAANAILEGPQTQEDAQLVAGMSTPQYMEWVGQQRGVRFGMKRFKNAPAVLIEQLETRRDILIAQIGEMEGEQE